MTDDRSWANKHVLAVTQYPVSVKKGGGASAENKRRNPNLVVTYSRPGQHHGLTATTFSDYYARGSLGWKILDPACHFRETQPSLCDPAFKRRVGLYDSRKRPILLYLALNCKDLNMYHSENPKDNDQPSRLDIDIEGQSPSPISQGTYA